MARGRKAATSDPRFQEIARERVADRIAQELLRLIAAGALAPGERLPGERQLAEMMRVSRVSVRAALQQLKALGFLSAVQGGGTRVMAAAAEVNAGLASLARADVRNLRDLAQIRAHLEAWAARRAARAASPAQRAEIERCLALLADPSRPAHLRGEDDLASHLAIAKATGSAVYLHLMSALGDVLEHMFEHQRHFVAATEADERRLLQQHRAIARAIARRDAAAAETAMAQHLAFVLSSYDRSLPASAALAADRVVG